MSKKFLLMAITALMAGTSYAKLASPVLNDEAKAKAAEAAAKTAHGNKVANFQLCKSMDRTAAHYYKGAKTAGKETKPPTETPACPDPGVFVFPPPATPVAVVPTAAAVAAAAKPAVAAVPAKK